MRQHEEVADDIISRYNLDREKLGDISKEVENLIRRLVYNYNRPVKVNSYTTDKYISNLTQKQADKLYEAIDNKEDRALEVLLTDNKAEYVRNGRAYRKIGTLTDELSKRNFIGVVDQILNCDREFICFGNTVNVVKEILQLQRDSIILKQNLIGINDDLVEGLYKDIILRDDKVLNRSIKERIFDAFNNDTNNSRNSLRKYHYVHIMSEDTSGYFKVYMQLSNMSDYTKSKMIVRDVAYKVVAEGLSIEDAVRASGLEMREYGLRAEGDLRGSTNFRCIVKKMMERGLI